MVTLSDFDTNEMGAGEDVSVRSICGGEHHPDHDTICVFRVRNEKAIGQAFPRVLKQKPKKNDKDDPGSPPVIPKPEPKHQVNLTDSDSRIMRKNNRSGYEQASNAPAVVGATGDASGDPVQELQARGMEVVVALGKPDSPPG